CFFTETAVQHLTPIKDMVRALISCSSMIGSALLLCSVGFGLTVQDTSGSKRAFTEREVTFKTEDGWTIHGVLSTPSVLAQGERIAGAVLVPSPAHDRDIYGHNGYPSIRSVLEKANIATLRIDIRGRGTSAEPRDYRYFTEEQKGRVNLDVAAAIEFLSGQKEVDENRIGVVAEAQSAEAAVVTASKDARVRALVLLSGRMGQPAKEAIKNRGDLSILGVVSKEDKVSFGDITDVYRLSRDPSSSLMIHRDIGLGNAMFIMNAAKFPNEKPLEVTVGEWLIARLQLSAESQEVSFQTSDGWTLSGSLRLPAPGSTPGAPGVVLVHSNLSDRYVFNHLEKALAAGGFAVLNFDFRGRGKSRGKGSYFDLPQQERDKGYLDVRAALDYLGSVNGVEKNRLAVVATSIGVRYGLKAATTDERVKAFVMLGGLPERAEVEKSHFPILFVSSLGIPQIAKAFQEFYGLTKDRGSYLLEFEGGGVGYHIFEIDESLEPLIVRWLKPQFALR
ncbi:MAG TPA: alpha/beta fold hydrolase, partial [Pyrinomonadaceae bacterium]|nr:alpha/beta fold hydrolase [Pyrinomonadaceae bacterium]